MNKIIFNYLLKNFFKSFFLVLLIFYCFGIILNLFEEVEFFKNIDVSALMPLILTGIYIPSMMIKILPVLELRRDQVLRKWLILIIQKKNQIKKQRLKVQM